MPEDATAEPAHTLPAERAVERQRLIKQCVFIFLISCICAAYVQVNPGWLPYGLGEDETVFTWNRAEGLPEGDGYYHIKAAYLYRTGEMSAAGEDFHWTRISMWNGQFSDKEFLYHIYLVPFTFMAEDEYHWQAFVNGAKFATIIAGGLFMLALFSTMRQLKIPKAWLWTLAAGGLMGVLMCVRLTEPRSWVFGVCLAMLGWAALWRGSRKWAFIIAILYVLAYTGSQLIFAMALFRLGFRFIMGPEVGTRKAALKADTILAGIVFAGLIVGWMLHPGSFALLKIWWVQNIMVPYTHAGGTPTGMIGAFTGWLLGWGPNASVPEVPPGLLGIELGGRTVVDMLRISTFEILAPVLVPCASAWLRVRPSHTTVATFVIALGFLFLSFHNGRFSEYSVPFMLIACASWGSEILNARNVRVRLKALKLPAVRQFQVALVALVVVLVVNLYRCGEEIGYRPKAHLLEAGEWMQQHPELKGKVIYNHSWDTFPELMMFRSDCDYIWGMDPVFTAARADANSLRVIGFMKGDWDGVPADMVRIMRDEMNVDYIFIYDRRAEQSLYIKLNAWADQGLLIPEFRHPTTGMAIYRLKR